MFEKGVGSVGKFGLTGSLLIWGEERLVNLVDIQANVL